MADIDRNLVAIAVPDGAIEQLGLHQTIPDQPDAFGEAAFAVREIEQRRRPRGRSARTAAGPATNRRRC